jgi:hypothetical protein
LLTTIGERAMFIEIESKQTERSSHAPNAHN